MDFDATDISKNFINRDLSVDDKNIIHFHNEKTIPLFDGINFNQVQEKIPGATEYIMYPWFPKKGIGFIYAATGVGKTLFTLNLAYAIAGGGRFLKYTCPKPRKILYIDGEMAYQQIHQRLMSIESQQGKLDFKENFILLNPDVVYPNKIPKICTEEGQDFYNRFIEKNQIDVVIFDNLSVLSMIDENKANEWNVIQNWLLTLRAKEISSIVIHHAGKEKMGYRGTSRMLDCVDTAISLQIVNDQNLESTRLDSKKIKIVYQKNRGFCGQDSFDFEAIIDSRGWSYQTMDQSNREMIIDRVKLGMNHKDIGIEIGVTRSYVSRIVREAIKLKLLPNKNNEAE